MEDATVEAMNQDVSLPAQAWYRASTTGLLPAEYSRFIALWEALCAWYRDVKGESRDDKLKSYLTDSCAGCHSEMLSGTNYSRHVDKLKSLTPIKIMKGSREVGEASITEIWNWSEVVTVIYTVRCNLMKGGKPSRPADRDSKVCKAANDVLDAIVYHLVFDTEGRHGDK